MRATGERGDKTSGPAGSKAPLSAPAAQAPLALQIASTVPPGFEQVSDVIDTLFDVTYAGERIGAFQARLENGQIRFANPQSVVDALPERIDRARALTLLSQTLPGNESERCLSGRTTGCGVLSAGQAGVIVTPERFAVELFVSNDYVLAADDTPVMLGAPVAGFSLIQTALVSVSTGTGALDRVRYGATLDTLASVGATALIAQTTVRDQGATIRQAYVQHLFDERRVAGGLLQDASSLTFNSYRVLGGEFGSFFGRRLDTLQGQDTPIEVILPRAATVEVFRAGTLISTTRLEAGVQRVPTTTFPAGSYPVQLIAREGGTVLLDETRIFTRAADLPPLGETAFRLRAGARVSDGFFLDPLRQNDLPFLPQTTGELLLNASASRRIAASTAVGIDVLAVDDRVFSEFSLLSYRGTSRGAVGAGVGTDGSYSAFVNAGAQFGVFNVYATGRHTRVKDELNNADILSGRRYRPFFRSEDQISANVSFPLMAGVLSTGGSYSRVRDFGERYALNARYNMPLNLGRLGAARMTLFGLKTTDDTRVGLTLSFFGRIDRNTSVSLSGGAEYRRRENGDRAGSVSPVAEARVSRTDRLGEFDLFSEAGVQTDSDRDRAYASALMASDYGTVDATVSYDRRGGVSDGVNLVGNAFSGFAIGGGKLKLGLRDQGGDALILADIDTGSATGRAGRDRLSDASDEGGYRVAIGNREYGFVRPGSTATLLLQSLRDYSIRLRPEGSPLFDVDLSPRRIPLYPGNVVRARFDASLVVSIFGRMVDAGGNPLGNVRVQAGGDVTSTDEQGRFTLTARESGEIQATDAAGKLCRPVSISNIIDPMSPAILYRIGDVRCDPSADK